MKVIISEMCLSAPELFGTITVVSFPPPQRRRKWILIVGGLGVIWIGVMMFM